MLASWDLESGAIGLEVLRSTNGLLGWLIVLVVMVAGDFGTIDVVAVG